MKCPSSALPIAAPVGGANPAADLGHAVHEGLRATLLGQDVSLPALVVRFALADEESLAMLLRYGLKAWGELSVHFPNCRVEERLESDIATGTADVVHHDGVTAAVLDWKTGREQSDYQAQLMAYAYALRAKYGMPESGVVKGVVVWLRDSTFDVWDFDDDALEAFKERMLASAPLVGREYNPGNHCGFCPRRNECVARAQYLKQSTAMVLQSETLLAERTNLGIAYERVKQLKHAIAQYDDALHAALLEGPIAVDDKYLCLESIGKDVIDPRKAWPILSDHGFTDDDVARCVKMTKGAIMDVVGSKTPRGTKQAARGQLLDDLRNGGAITQVTEQRIKERHCGQGLSLRSEDGRSIGSP